MAHAPPPPPRLTAEEQRRHQENIIGVLTRLQLKTAEIYADFQLAVGTSVGDARWLAEMAAGAPLGPTPGPGQTEERARAAFRQSLREKNRRELERDLDVASSIYNPNAPFPEGVGRHTVKTEMELRLEQEFETNAAMAFLYRDVPAARYMKAHKEVRKAMYERKQQQLRDRPPTDIDVIAKFLENPPPASLTGPWRQRFLKALQIAAHELGEYLTGSLTKSVATTQAKGGKEKGGGTITWVWNGVKWVALTTLVTGWKVPIAVAGGIAGALADRKRAEPKPPKPPKEKKKDKNGPPDDWDPNWDDPADYAPLPQSYFKTATDAVSSAASTTASFGLSAVTTTAGALGSFGFSAASALIGLLINPSAVKLLGYVVAFTVVNALTGGYAFPVARAAAEWLGGMIWSFCLDPFMTWVGTFPATSAFGALAQTTIGTYNLGAETVGLLGSLGLPAALVNTALTTGLMGAHGVTSFWGNLGSVVYDNNVLNTETMKALAAGGVSVAPAGIMAAIWGATTALGSSVSNIMTSAARWESMNYDVKREMRLDAAYRYELVTGLKFTGYANIATRESMNAAALADFDALGKFMDKGMMIGGTPWLLGYFMANEGEAAAVGALIDKLSAPGGGGMLSTVTAQQRMGLCKAIVGAVIVGRQSTSLLMSAFTNGRVGADLERDVHLAVMQCYLSLQVASNLAARGEQSEYSLMRKTLKAALDPTMTLPKLEGMFNISPMGDFKTAFVNPFGMARDMSLSEGVTDRMEKVADQINTLNSLIQTYEKWLAKMIADQNSGVRIWVADLTGGEVYEDIDGALLEMLQFRHAVSLLDVNVRAYFEMMENTYLAKFAASGTTYRSGETAFQGTLLLHPEIWPERRVGGESTEDRLRLNGEAGMRVDSKTLRDLVELREKINALQRNAAASSRIYEEKRTLQTETAAHFRMLDRSLDAEAPRHRRTQNLQWGQEFQFAPSLAAAKNDWLLREHYETIQEILRQGTLTMPESHVLDSLRVSFDHLVGAHNKIMALRMDKAGLRLAMTAADINTRDDYETFRKKRLRSKYGQVATAEEAAVYGSAADWVEHVQVSNGKIPQITQGYMKFYETVKSQMFDDTYRTTIMRNVRELAEKRQLGWAKFVLGPPPEKKPESAVATKEEKKPEKPGRYIALGKTGYFMRLWDLEPDPPPPAPPDVGMPTETQRGGILETLKGLVGLSASTVKTAVRATTLQDEEKQPDFVADTSIATPHGDAEVNAWVINTILAFGTSSQRTALIAHLAVKSAVLETISERELLHDGRLANTLGAYNAAMANYYMMRFDAKFVGLNESESLTKMSYLLDDAREMREQALALGATPWEPQDTLQDLWRTLPTDEEIDVKRLEVQELQKRSGKNEAEERRIRLEFMHAQKELKMMLELRDEDNFPKPVEVSWAPVSVRQQQAATRYMRRTYSKEDQRRLQKEARQNVNVHLSQPTRVAAMRHRDTSQHLEGKKRFKEEADRLKQEREAEEDFATNLDAPEPGYEANWLLEPDSAAHSLMGRMRRFAYTEFRALYAAFSAQGIQFVPIEDLRAELHAQREARQKEQEARDQKTRERSQQPMSFFQKMLALAGAVGVARAGVATQGGGITGEDVDNAKRDEKAAVASAAASPAAVAAAAQRAAAPATAAAKRPVERVYRSAADALAE